MRQVSKQQPQTNVSPPGQLPRTLAQAAVDFGNGVPSSDARSAFDALHKPALRQPLYVEQHHVCVFCEQEIRESAPAPPIDHWRPVCLHPRDAFTWDNLHLSCSTPDTCDTRKGSRPLQANPTDPYLPWPGQYAYEEVLGFTSGGMIYVRRDATLSPAMRGALELAIDGQPGIAGRRAAILNLNAAKLREARAAAIDDEVYALQADFGETTPAPEQLQARAASLLAAERWPGFVSIRVAWLRGEVGQGR